MAPKTPDTQKVVRTEKGIEVRTDLGGTVEDDLYSYLIKNLGDQRDRNSGVSAIGGSNANNSVPLVVNNGKTIEKKGECTSGFYRPIQPPINIGNRESVTGERSVVCKFGENMIGASFQTIAKEGELLTTRRITLGWDAQKGKNNPTNNTTTFDPQNIGIWNTPVEGLSVKTPLTVGNAEITLKDIQDGQKGKGLTIRN